MRKNSARIVFLVSAVLIVAGATACVSMQKLPLMDGKETVALVNGEPISREEYEQEISSMHASILSEEQKAGGKKPGRVDYAGLMNRLINTRLILQEARNMGLYNLPEVRQLAEVYSKTTLRAVLLKEQGKDVIPDEAMVEKFYRKAVGEWKFASAMFAHEDDARKMETEARARAGKNFDELAEKAVAEGKAKGGKAEGYLKGETISSTISDVLISMTTGSISPIIPIPAGYALIKLEDVHYEESPEKMDLARKEVLQMQRSKVAHEFIEALKTKYVKTNQAILDGLDYGASLEKFEELMKDERIIAEIEGDTPIKVSDLGDELRQKYFHGIDRAIGRKELNAKKYSVFDGMLEKRVLLKEAYVENIQQTASYQKIVKNYENSVVFGVFVQKVVVPAVTVMESEIKAYYQEHLSEYTSPGMMRLDSIVFKERPRAEEAMRKLREGDQLSWLKAHSEGQVDASQDKDAKEFLALTGNVVTSRELPDDLKRALADVNSGDVRLYESPEGYFYVISIMAVYPVQTEDYLSVRETIAKRLFDQHITKGVEDWADKLRAGSDIRVYIE